MIDNGWLVAAQQVPSPNYDDRPANTVISLLVIHAISLPPGEFGGEDINRLFTNCLDPGAHPYFSEICHLQVSSHLLIRRSGEIVQYVPFDKRAWHAGESCYRGRENCNDFSIGIELEGTDEIAYEDIQYDVLQTVIAAIRNAYPHIGESDVVGHCDIAPGRKTDPGPLFEWQRIGVTKPL